MYEQLKETVRNYYAQLAPRERVMVLWGAVFVVLAMFYAVVWYPIVNYRDSAASALMQQQELLEWMQASANEVKQLGGARAGGGIPGESLLSAVDRTARMNKLGDALKRVEPEGENRVRVALEGASFDDLIAWLERAQNDNHMRVETASIDKENSPGRVTARLTMEGAR